MTQDMVEAEGLATRATNLEKQKASAQRQVAAEHERLAQQRSVGAEAVGAAEAAEQEFLNQQTHNQCAPAPPGRMDRSLRLHHAARCAEGSCQPRHGEQCSVLVCMRLRVAWGMLTALGRRD